MEELVFLIVKFNKQLFAAAQSTALAVQRGDEVGAMQEARAIAGTVQPLSSRRNARRTMR